MKALLTAIKENGILICDGAMGTLLHGKGLEQGACPELWCIENPESVKDIHKQYKEAGSNIVETNSFGGNKYKLTHFGLNDRVYEINNAAASIAREVAQHDQYVLGSVGPTGQFMAPLGLETEDNFYNAFKDQCIALEEGGADAVIIETMTALEEALVALKAARDNTKLVTIVSFTFDPKQAGGYASMMGVTPHAFAEAAASAGADIIGSNCGTGPEHMINIVNELKIGAPGTPIMAMPNAGMPVLDNGQTVFKKSPIQMAENMKRIIEAGASIIGGCCGTTPNHIAEMHKLINS